MSEQQEHELDKLSGMVIRKAGLETPPERLKQNIMQAIVAKSTYRPIQGLLTTKSKIAIGVFIIGFCIAIGFLPQTNKLWQVSGGLEGFTGYMNQISKDIPKTFFYGILAFGILVLVQIAYLKKRINNI